MKIIIDAKDEVVGRIGSYAAKQLLQGQEVAIINVEEAVISGNKADILSKIKRLRNIGGSSQKGPKMSKLPDLLVKRMIRGMLPWDKSKGRNVFHHLRCYVGKGDLKDEEVKSAKALGFKKPMKFITIKEIVKLL